jgi:hypothetical protein
VVGLGCDSGAYIFYGLAATAVWLLQMLSAALSHCWSVRQELHGTSPPTWLSLGAFAVYTRLAGNTLAVFNAVWVVTFSIFQLTSLYGNCWCASPALQHGSKNWAVLFATPAQIFTASSEAWITGMFIAIICACYCGVFLPLAKRDDHFRMDEK